MPSGTVVRVFRHPETTTPEESAAERLSFLHLDADPACTGAQLAETGAERVA